MLILDGHSSHLTSTFIAYCFENKILLIIYPPQATHTLQPLDVGCGQWTQSQSSKKFPPPTTDNKEDPESEQLEKVLCRKDLQRLFNQVVPDQSTKEAKTLSSSLHYLSTQFALKSAENTGLRASLEGRKKHRVKGQVLPYLTNNSGSLTLSPITVEKALKAEKPDQRLQGRQLKRTNLPCKQ
jgi:hypothetical protein